LIAHFFLKMAQGLIYESRQVYKGSSWTLNLKTRPILDPHGIKHASICSLITYEQNEKVFALFCSFDWLWNFDSLTHKFLRVNTLLSIFNMSHSLKRFFSYFDKMVSTRIKLVNSTKLCSLMKNLETNEKYTLN
jgi:hypothetical protein